MNIECPKCKFFYSEDMFKPIYDIETMELNGKDPELILEEKCTCDGCIGDLIQSDRPSKYCEYCQDKILKGEIKIVV